MALIEMKWVVTHALPNEYSKCNVFGPCVIVMGVGKGHSVKLSPSPPPPLLVGVAVTFVLSSSCLLTNLFLTWVAGEGLGDTSPLKLQATLNAVFAASCKNSCQSIPPSILCPHVSTYSADDRSVQVLRVVCRQQEIYCPILCMN